jgi:SAM-dependent methyltransferase
MTSFYDRHIMPRLIGCACGAKPITYQRRKVVPKAAGKVLELGIGGGMNLIHYDAAQVASVSGVDPSAELRAIAQKAPRAEGLKVDIQDGTAEALPYPDASFDCVVCTFTLCSVASPPAALAEARRVLKPGGRFLFCEHGLSPDPKVADWQRFIEPLWKRLAGGCHLTRPVGAAITAAGFALADLNTMYLPSTPKSVGWNEWGEARAN